jgi:FixJ family two-component response regulator
MAETHVSKCFWFSGPGEKGLDSLSGSFASQFHIETQPIGVEQDYSLLEWQLPGVVVVLDATADDPLNSADLQTGRIAEVHAHSKKPTIVCIGNRVPTGMFVDWMRQSIFAYAEADTSKDRLQVLIAAAIEHANSVQTRFERFQFLNTRKASLTQAEKQVLEMILEGVPNKTIATKLGVSQRTIEARRQKLYLKMGSKSLPGVVQSICEWRQLSSEFSGIVFADTMTDGGRPVRSSKTELIHIGQRIAAPKLQSLVRQPKADVNCL